MTAVLETSAPVRPVEPAARPPYRWRWLAYSAVLTATVMDLLDSTVMGIAAPAIRGDLGGGTASMQWMAAGYTMALAVLLLVGGRLGDLYGRKRVLMVGVAGFTFTSLVCALAVSPGMLVGSRVAQGAFAAVMLPQGFGIARDLFSRDEMAKAWGVFGPIMGLSAVIGPIVGGSLLDADLFGTGWRAIFLVNLPIGAYVLIVAGRFLPAVPPSDRSATLDVPGLLLAGAGLFALVYPLVQGRELGWPTWLQGLLASSLPLLGVFGWYQARRRRSGRSTLIETSVFRSRAYVSGVFFAVIFFGAMAGTFVLGIFLQLGLGFSAIHASLTMAPWAVGAMVGSAFGGIMMARLGRRILHLGVALMAAGLGLMVAVFSVAGVGVSHWDLVAPNLIGGAGMGMVFVPLFDIILGGVRDHEVGSASGMLGSFEQLGIALGIAVIGSVFFGRMESGATDHRLAAVDGVQVATLATVGLLVAGFAVGFLLPRKAREGGGH